jgi:uncharacterized sporulation protein YeaH/YhbH (DUF444 family)
MAIFRDYDPCGRERSSEDRRRHKELVEDSIKRNIGNIISEESIIGQSGSKKIKVPVKGIKEYSFIYGSNRKGAATGDGDEKRGDVVGDDSDGSIYGHGGAGNLEGEDIYETEITIEELVGYLFDDLNLPDLDQKKLSQYESVKGYRKLGYQKKGIPPRLAIRRSVVEKIRRKQSYKRSLAEIEKEQDGEGKVVRQDSATCEGAVISGDADTCEDAAFYEDADMLSYTDQIDPESLAPAGDTDKCGRFAFAEEDLRYRRLREIRKKDFNAVVICIMDVSGSMDHTKKYMARSFYFLLYQFLRHKYSNVEVVFIAHTTTAKVVSELEFFHRGESGGTYISSGYEKALEVIEQHYNPTNWNIYTFHCSDGDNWTEDNERAVEYARKLC